MLHSVSKTLLEIFYQNKKSRWYKNSHKIETKILNRMNEAKTLNFMGRNNRRGYGA